MKLEILSQMVVQTFRFLWLEEGQILLEGVSPPPLPQAPGENDVSVRKLIII